jgi:hypothetical protein
MVLVRRGLLRCGNTTGTEIIERKVQGEDIDAGLPEDTELAGLGMLCNERLHILLVQVPFPGYAGNLVLGSSDADIRVKTAS